MYGSDADRDGLPEMGNLLKNWIITDIDCGVLNRHNGPMLERYGATIKNIDIFQLFRDTELTGSPCLVVMGCLCPPTSHKDYLIHLIKKYNNFNPNPAERRTAYDSWAFEAVVGQMEKATVVQIVRSGDYQKTGSTPAVTAPLAHVPGYIARACNHPQDDELVPLQGQQHMVAKISTRGPLDPRDFVGYAGAFNLVGACASATALGMKVLFLAEWDGSLSWGCALGMMYVGHCQDCPIIDYQTPVAPLERTLGGETGDYRDFYMHAESHRCIELFEKIKKEGGVLPEVWPPNLQPHASLNAAAMWYHATIATSMGAPGRINLAANVFELSSSWTSRGVHS